MKRAWVVAVKVIDKMFPKIIFESIVYCGSGQGKIYDWQYIPQAGDSSKVEVLGEIIYWCMVDKCICS